MRRHHIPQFKMNHMRRSFIDGTFVSNRLAKELKISTVTSWRYWKEFVRIKEQFPDRLEDMDFYMKDPPPAHRSTPLYDHFVKVLPSLIAKEKPGIKSMPLWHKYKILYPEGYSYSPFKILFNKWLEAHPEMAKPRLLDKIAACDVKQLKTWRNSNDHRNWQLAVALQMAVDGYRAIPIMEKTEIGRLTLTKWLKAYRAKGLKGLYKPPQTIHPSVAKKMQGRKDEILKLLHETPKAHGLNRTSWSILALSQVYNIIYPEKQLTYMQVSLCLRQLGIKYKKSRDMLTSQDPNFREKINKIQRILQKLKPDEKFFSIDEYGGVSIKLKGGRTLKQPGESPDGIPSKQKCRGFIICTAALELSTNQVTHFFSLKKNTFEMIKLIDILLLEYYDQSCLYLSWDAVSWHNSQILKNYIEDHNKEKLPKVVVVPLPACTQFLNVIESVFGGLAKAVIHNSDYNDVEECKAAISLHFETRNQHFLKNPKRAGKKIWGKEAVVPKFKETHHCRVRGAMRGAK